MDGAGKVKEKKEKKDKKEKKEKKSKEEKKEKKEAKRPIESEKLTEAPPKLPRVEEPVNLAPAEAIPAIEELTEPAVNFAAGPDDDEVNFWDALEATEEVKPGVPLQPKVTITGECGVLQVPPEAAEELSRSIARIAMLTGASLTIRNNVLTVSGSLASRTQAERYARMVVERRLGPEGQGEAAFVYVPQEWAQEAASNIQAIEEQLGVLVCYEETKGAHIFRSPGQIVEVNWEKRGWHLATVLGPGPRGLIRVRWSFDGSCEEVVSSTVRMAQRIIICGQPRPRVQMQVRLLAMAEKAIKGVMATQLAVNSTTSGLGVEQVKLTVNYMTIKRLADNRLVEVVINATDCVAVELYSIPRGTTQGTEQCAMVAGTREQRWRAGQLVQLLATGLESRTVRQIPDHLLGECRSIKVPQQSIKVIIGKAHSNLHSLMWETKTVVIMTKEEKGRSKKDVSEVDDLLEVMFDHVREGPTTEFVIFGSQRAQLAAQVRLMATIEAQFTGFYPKPDADNEELERTESLGVDKLWFEADFEPDASRQRGNMLGAAAGCLAEAVGRLLLIHGTGAERRRGREYSRWMVGKIKGKQPQVANLSSRTDVATLEVPVEATKNKWLRPELEKMSLETKSWIFFDSGEGTEDPEAARLVLAGVQLERDPELRDRLLRDVKQLVDDAITYGVPSSAYNYNSGKDQWKNSDWNSWGGWNSGGNNWGSGWGGGWSWDQQNQANVPPPATPAPGGMGRGVGVPPPATPVPGRSQVGVPPPATPAPGGAGVGVPPPATPAPGRGSNVNVPPPATPGGPGGFGPHGTAAPSTPAPRGFGVAPPATPAGPSIAAPATPAPSAFGPHGTKAPSTPAPGAGGGAAMAPATPAGFGPHGTAAPSTPAPAGFKGVPPPATPGLVGVAPPRTPAPGLVGVAPPATPAPGAGAGMPPPATPGGLVGVAPPATPAPGGGLIRGVPPPATPGAPLPVKRGVAAPQTPAFPGAGAGAEAEEPTKQKVAAPQTPAFLGGSEEKKAPPPQTPAFPALSAEKKLTVPGPQTPAFLGASSPQTPAFPGAAVAPEPAAPAPQQSPPRDTPPPKSSGKLLSFSNVRKEPSKESLAEPAEVLPPGWTKMTSKSNGKVYYWNGKLKQSQYEVPTK